MFGIRRLTRCKTTPRFASSKKLPRASRSKRQLLVEPLEDRRLLSVTAAAMATTNIYDENAIQPNAVDFVATGSSMTTSQFANDVMYAYRYNTGGVIDGSALGSYYKFGWSGDKVLKIVPADGTNWAIGSPTDPLPISKTGAFASTADGGYDFTSLDFADVESGDPNERVVQFGVTVLSTTNRDFGNVTVTGRLASGEITSASRAIREPAGAGDTFFGFAAPAGDYFTGFSIRYRGEAAASSPIFFDDVGFITAIVPFATNRPPIAQDNSYVIAEDHVLSVPAVAESPLLDQESVQSGWWFNAGLAEYNLQQQVRAGVAGRLDAVEIFIGANSAVGASFEFYVNRGSAWQSDDRDFASVVTITSEMLGQWVSIDVSSAGIMLSAGDDFTFGAWRGNGQTALLIGGEETSETDPYPDGKLWRNGNELGGTRRFDLRFRTHMAAATGILANDADPDRDVLTAVLVAGPSHGSLTLAPDGSFTYTPDADYHGPDSFTYQAFDGEAYSDIATVTIDVTSVNDAPVAADLHAAIPENSPVGTLVGSVAATDVEGDPLTYRITGGTGADAFAIHPATGELTIADAAKLDFETSQQFTLEIEVSDGQLSDAALVTIDLLDVVDTVDFVPGDDSNTIDLKNSRVAVAILSTAWFDAATEVVVDALRFGATGDEDSLERHKKLGPRVDWVDVDGDGLLDLIAYFTTSKTGLDPDSTDAVLKGMLIDGTRFEFADAVAVQSGGGGGNGKGNK